MAPFAAKARPEAPQPAPNSSTAFPCQKLAPTPEASAARPIRSRSNSSTSSQKATADCQTTAPKPKGNAFSQFV
eukprot:CAMPEP_0204108146 /NCGR_PEP_ID=MMETSP0361-20130328/546_1 /ASSEMBLY_ACC=CAM_ASM_000343 /TAXON_ID=268821 /ORGANISM="Scrippsiella Hangoei, Strain SHTV-5" /LENGTH=73 /DNA_ID=CAMNT_0051057729 /DNA_START=21 /DNA_END=239 /DNA_ORIENTATION=+